MDVKLAVKIAKGHVADLFAQEEISNVGLEAVEFDDSQDRWKVTIGFSRPWHPQNVLAAALREGHPARSYKVVEIASTDGRLLSLQDHFLSEPG